MLRTKYYRSIEKLEHNGNYFSAYLDYLEKDDKLKDGSKKTYLGKITPFLKILDKLEIDLKNITGTDEIKKYADEENIAIEEGFLNALAGLFLVAGSLATLQITEEEIKKIPKKKEPFRQAIPLTISEVIQIRNKLQARNEYHLAFVFEVFFTYGITLDQFENIEKENFLLEENIFILSPSEGYILSKIIVELLKAHNDLPNHKVRVTTQGHIRDIGSFIKRDKLIWQDIIKTRTEYFPVCPDCQFRYPNTDEFWALLEYELDASKSRWLYCRKCMNKRLGGESNG